MQLPWNQSGGASRDNSCFGVHILCYHGGSTPSKLRNVPIELPHTPSLAPPPHHSVTASKGNISTFPQLLYPAMACPPHKTRKTDINPESCRA